jgi:DNA repair protein RadD
VTVALRDYQRTAVDAVRAAYAEGARAPLLVAPTGAGKTVMFSYVALSAAERGRRVLILVHRRELIRQSAAKLAAAGVRYGIIAPGNTPNREAVQVASVQTLARRLGDPRYPAPDLIVIDEAHHAVAGQWATVCKAYPDAKLLGVTATPERMDGKGLGVKAGGPFDALILGPSVASLMEQGFLSTTRVLAPAVAPDLSEVRTSMGDFRSGDLEAEMDRPSITGDVVAHYARHAAGLPTIAFCISVQHAVNVAATLREHGWRAVAASGSTPPAERDAAIAGLADGRVQILCSCDLISEGLDVPAVGAVILLRPTKSLGLYLQQVGRGLRPAPGKPNLVVLDHAGNTLRHGLIEADRPWSLDGRPKGDKAPATMRCTSCFAIHAPSPSCPECGHIYPRADEPGEGRQIAQRDGDLTEIDQDKMAALRAKPLRDLLRSATSREALEEIARARGYKKGWIFHIMRTRAGQGAPA